MLKLFVPGESRPSTDLRTPLPAWMNELILSMVKSLDERSAAVLRLRYGLAGDDPLALSEVATRMDSDEGSVR